MKLPRLVVHFFFDSNVYGDNCNQVRFSYRFKGQHKDIVCKIPIIESNKESLMQVLASGTIALVQSLEEIGYLKDDPKESIIAST